TGGALGFDLEAQQVSVETQIPGVSSQGIPNTCTLRPLRWSRTIEMSQVSLSPLRLGTEEEANLLHLFECVGEETESPGVEVGGGDSHLEWFSPGLENPSEVTVQSVGNGRIVGVGCEFGTAQIAHQPPASDKKRR